MKKNITLTVVMMIIISVLFAGCSSKPEKSVQLNDGDVIGEGSITFQLNIVDDKEESIGVSINTDEKTLGDALQTLGIISGEKGPYGLYITRVNGIYADYDNDKTYWALYENGKYAETSIDKIEISSNGEYTLKFEKTM